MSFSRLSLLWKILLPTSAVLTVVFAAAGWIVQENVIRTTSESVGHEAKASFQAYESLWKARADRLPASKRKAITEKRQRRVDPKNRYNRVGFGRDQRPTHGPLPAPSQVTGSGPYP